MATLYDQLRKAHAAKKEALALPDSPETREAILKASRDIIRIDGEILRKQHEAE